MIELLGFRLREACRKLCVRLHNAFFFQAGSYDSNFAHAWIGNAAQVGSIQN